MAIPDHLTLGLCRLKPEKYLCGVTVDDYKTYKTKTLSIFVFSSPLISHYFNN